MNCLKSAVKPMLMVLLLAVASGHAGAQAPEAIKDWKRLGTVQPRHAREIKSSTWSIGGETMDRDYTIYKNWREYLGPLGAKAVRLQAGWAKCEKEPGVYNWAWLDEIIDDAIAQGVRPWVETSYGNPIYPNGGGTGLGGGLPKSPEALAAWDNWVGALVARYKDRVNEWEVWNEPDHQNVDDYTKLFIRTAEIIRAEQPDARIYALALAGNMKFAEGFLGRIKEAGKAELMTAVTVHGYPRNPDSTSTVDQMAKLLAKHGIAIPVRQGETGAPSKFQSVLALSNIPWTETMQAKYNMRRMLAHHAKGVPFSLFQIMDMHYGADAKGQINWKGQLETRPDKTVSHAKRSYFAAQRVFTIFDDRLKADKDFEWASAPAMTTATLAAYGYGDAQGRQVVTLWKREQPPTDESVFSDIDITFAKGGFKEPVYVDMLSGEAFEIPAGRIERKGSGVTFKGIPVYDSVVLIAERDLIPLKAAE